MKTKNTLKKALVAICVLALLVSVLPASVFAEEEIEIPEEDYLYVNGESKVLTAGEEMYLLRLVVENAGKVHVLSSGVDITMVLFDETAEEVRGVYTSEHGLMDVPFFAAPGMFLLGVTGDGEVEILAADETETGEIYTADEPAEEAVEAPAEEVAEQPAEEAVEAPVEEVAEQPAEEAVEAPVEEVVAAPVEEVVEQPAEEAVEEIAEEVAAAPVEEVAEQPAEEAVDAPVEEAVDAPAEEVSEEPEEKKGFLGGFVDWLSGTPSAEKDEGIAEAPAEEAVEAPVEEVAEQPAEEAVEEAVEEVAEQPVEEAVEEVAEQPAEDVVEDIVEAPVEEAVEAPVEEAAEQPAEEAVEVPAEEVVEEPAFDPSVPVQVQAAAQETVSVLTVLKEAGAPVEFVAEVTGELEGKVFSSGIQAGDCLLTPYVYFDSVPVTVKDANGTVYTLVLANPDPNPPVVEEPVEEVIEQPAEEAVEAPVEEPTEQPAEEAVDAPVEELAEQPVEDIVEEVVEEVAEQPAEAVVEEAVEEVAEQPAEEAAETVDGQAQFEADYANEIALYRQYGEWADLSSVPYEAQLRIKELVDGKETESVVEEEEPPASITEVTIAAERGEGNEVRLFAENIDEEVNDNYLYQWQYSLNGEEWMDVEGANGSDYTFQLDETNGGYYWRLILSEK